MVDDPSGPPPLPGEEDFDLFDRSVDILIEDNRGGNTDDNRQLNDDVDMSDVGPGPDNEGGSDETAADTLIAVSVPDGTVDQAGEAAPAPHVPPSDNDANIANPTIALHGPRSPRADFVDRLAADKAWQNRLQDSLNQQVEAELRKQRAARQEINLLVERAQQDLREAQAAKEARKRAKQEAMDRAALKKAEEDFLRETLQETLAHNEEYLQGEEDRQDLLRQLAALRAEVSNAKEEEEAARIAEEATRPPTFATIAASPAPARSAPRATMPSRTALRPPATSPAAPRARTTTNRPATSPVAQSTPRPTAHRRAGRDDIGPSWFDETAAHQASATDRSLAASRHAPQPSVIVTGKLDTPVWAEGMDMVKHIRSFMRECAMKNIGGEYLQQQLERRLPAGIRYAVWQDAETGVVFQPDDTPDLAERIQRSVITAHGGTTTGSAASQYLRDLQTATWNKSAERIDQYIGRHMRTYNLLCQAKGWDAEMCRDQEWHLCVHNMIQNLDASITQDFQPEQEYTFAQARAMLIARVNSLAHVGDAVLQGAQLAGKANTNRPSPSSSSSVSITAQSTGATAGSRKRKAPVAPSAGGPAAGPTSLRSNTETPCRYEKKAGGCRWVKCPYRHETPKRQRGATPKPAQDAASKPPPPLILSDPLDWNSRCVLHTEAAHTNRDCKKRPDHPCDKIEAAGRANRAS